MRGDVSTALAIGCMCAVAALDLSINPSSQLPTAVISGLLGWLSHRPAPAGPPP